MEQKIEIWRIKQFRKFCFLWAQKNPKELHSIIKKKSQLINNKKVSWLSYWFPKAKENELKQLENCVDNTKMKMLKRSVTMVIQKILIAISLKTTNGKQPFLNINAINSQFDWHTTPIKNENNDIQYQKQKKITNQKLVIEYDQYCGNNENNRYFLCDKRTNKSNLSDDQFEDIQNFLQCSITQKQILINILPIVIKFNNEIYQKILIFKPQRIHSTFCGAQALILEQNVLQYEKLEIKKQSVVFKMKALQFCLPENLYEKQVQNILIGLNEIQFIDNINIQNLNIKQVKCNALLFIQQQQKMDINQQINKYEKNKPRKYQILEDIQLFNTSIQIKKLINNIFSQVNWIINPIKIQIKQISQLKQLIRLLAKLRPKTKHKKQLDKLKQYHRKQSIGQQFIDACQNLQQHILKSSSGMLKSRSDRYVIKDNKQIKNSIQINSIQIILQSTSLSIKKIRFWINQLMDYNSIQTTQQQTNIDIKVQNIKNFTTNLQKLTNQISRSLQLNNKNNQLINKNIQNIQLSDQISLGVIAICIDIYDNNKLQFSLQCKNGMFKIQRDRSVKLQMQCGLSHYQNHLSPQIQAQPLYQKQYKQYLIEMFKIIYTQTQQYNKQYSIKITDINLNIKPNILLQLGNIFDRFNTPQKLKISIINSTINIINISTTQNKYKQYGQNTIAISTKYTCNIIIFNKLYQLKFIPQNKIQKIKLTSKLFLLKKMKSQYVFTLQSNLRITNRQQYTIELKITYEKDEKKQKKNKKQNHHTSPKTNVKRKSSMHQKYHDVDLDQYIQRNFASVLKTKDNSIISPLSDQYQLMEMSGQILKFNKTNILHSKIKSNKNYETYKILIAPQQTIHLLLQSQNYYIQILQYNKNEIHESYDAFCVSQILKDNNQQLVYSYHEQKKNNSDEDDENASSILIVSTTIINQQQMQKSNQIYHIQILSPFVMVSKIPQTMHFKISQEQTVTKTGKQTKKRSFEVIQKQILQPFKISRVNKFLYKYISNVQIDVLRYSKNFRLDDIIQAVTKNVHDIDTRYVDILSLNNGYDQIQMGIQIRILHNIIKITIFPQYILVNMTSIPIKLQIQQQNYNYMPILMKPLKDNKKYKTYIKMKNQQLCRYKILQNLFKEYQIFHILTWTGQLKQNVNRNAKFGDDDKQNSSKLFDSNDIMQNNRFKQKQITYGNNQHKIIARKIKIDDKPIYLLLFMPPLLIINKSDWRFIIKIKTQTKFYGQPLTKLQKHSAQYLVVNDTVNIQACDQNQEIQYGDWLKITLDSLGIFYYVKQIKSSCGYESREFELRKKRLKKIPKLFFRIVMTKYEYGHQILIEQSQYPPVTFINRCKFKVRVKEITDDFKQVMDCNGMAEYASKILHHHPLFQIQIAQDYQFRKIGQFYLKQTQQIIFNKEVKIIIQEYKDKKIVIIDNMLINDKNNILKQANELLPQKIQKYILKIDRIQISLLNNFNKQLHCIYMKNIELNLQLKNTKKYIKFKIIDIQIYNYNGLQPRHLLYFQHPKSFGLFKKKVAINQSLIGFSTKNLIINSSKNIISNGMIITQPIFIDNQQQIQPILNIDLIIDYHKHATILQKCNFQIKNIILAINPNGLIDCIKYYHKQLQQVYKIIIKHQFGKMLFDTIYSFFYQNNNNNSQQVFMQEDKNNRFQRVRHRNNVESDNYYNHLLNSNDNKVSILDRPFIIQKLKMSGLRLRLKFENLQNLLYFIEDYNINIKNQYLIKYLAWIGILRPISLLNIKQIRYQQYTIMKFIQQINFDQLINYIQDGCLFGLFATLTDSQGLKKILMNTSQKLYKILYRFTSNYILSNNQQQINEKIYQDKQQQIDKKDQDILKKIKKINYYQWHFKNISDQYKLRIQISRLQRYTQPNKLLGYDKFKSRIQTAINIKQRNKNFREIILIQPVNNNTFIGITTDWFVLYKIDKQEWLIKRHEEVIKIKLVKLKKSLSFSNFYKNSQSRQLKLTLLTIALDQNKNNQQFQQYTFNQVIINQNQIESLQKLIYQNKLTCVY